MKAITILEPYASLIACGMKKIETRSWATSYRGKIAIHAGKSKKFTETMEIIPTSFSTFKGIELPYDFNIDYGKVIAIADLVDCYYIVYHPGTDIDVAKNIHIGAESMTNDKHHPDFGKYIVPSSQEFALGDWTAGRYAWILENVQRIAPIPAKGQQRIWNWDGME